MIIMTLMQSKIPRFNKLLLFHCSAHLGRPGSFGLFDIWGSHNQCNLYW